jgi:hypothetical protein
MTRQTLKNIKRMMDGINAIDGLRVCGKPDATIFAYESTDPKVNIYAVADQMEEKGWFINRQQRPESLHAMVTMAHTESLEQYLKDLRLAVETVRCQPETNYEGKAAMYGMMAKIPFRGMLKKSVLTMMEQMYSAEGKMPGPKSGDPQNLMELAEKIGYSVLEVKREFDVVMEKVKKRLRQ